MSASNLNLAVEGRGTNRGFALAGCLETGSLTVAAL